MITTADFDPRRPPHFISARARQIFNEITTELDERGENLNACYSLTVAASFAVDVAEQISASYDAGRATAHRRANAIALAAGALSRLEISRRLPSPAATDRRTL